MSRSLAGVGEEQEQLAALGCQMREVGSGPVN